MDGMPLNQSNFENTSASCSEYPHPVWPYFLGSSVAFPVFLAVLLGIWRGARAVSRICRHLDSYDTVSDGRSLLNNPGAGRMEDDRASWPARVKRFSGKLVSGQLLTGKILIMLEFMAGIAVLIVYFHQVSWTPFSIEVCEDWYQRTDWQIEFVCNIFLLLVFALRFIAANEKLWFMVDIYSIVDYGTIPPAVISLAWHRDWIGLRCLRACHLLTIPEILQFFNILKTRAAIRLAQLTCQLLAVLLVASGIFHLLESTSGVSNFTTDGNSAQTRSYWEFVYFAIVTLSTVGYGDISPQTTIGRLFCCLFIISALALFASAIPEVFVLLSSRKKHAGAFKAERGTGHIVVTGHINLATMTKIMREFHRKDQRRDDLKLVFVDYAEPDLEMESYLKRNATRVIFLQGTLVRVEDLKRANLLDALACLVVTNKNSADPEKDDSTAIMTVTSIKNYSPSTRCIVQILQTKAKNLLVNIPAFTVKRGDGVICFQELELALMAQSCLSPGCGTLLLNLMCAPAYNMDLSRADQLIQDYAQGCQMEVHLEAFSPFFKDLNFCDAAAFCKKRLDLLLIGLFKPMRDNTKPGMLLCPTSMIISSDRIGIFVAPSENDANRARDYCETCHNDVLDIVLITPCHCTEIGIRPAKTRSRQRNPFERLLSITNASDVSKIRHSTLLKPPPGWEKKLLAHLQDNQTPRHQRREDGIPMLPIFVPLQRSVDSRRKRWANDIIKLDMTGNFYWCPARTFQSVILGKSAAALRLFKNHVIVLIMAHPDDPPIGLRELVVPMRSSRIPYDQLKEIIFLGNPSFLEREWSELYNLPKISMVKGDPLSRADLRAVSIRHCSMCVVLSAWTGTSLDPVLDDKAAILAALNIKAMPFEDEEEEEEEEEKCGKPREGESFVVPMTIELQENGSREPSLPYIVPVTVELQHDVNVRLLEDADVHVDSVGQEHLLLMEPFLSGQTVTFGTLDSLLVTSFRNPLAITIMQALLYGFKSPMLENLLAEGVGFVGGDDYSEEAVSPYGTRIRLLPVDGGPWTLPKNSTKELNYSVLFEAAAQAGMICLGISRKFSASKERAKSRKRCVLTNPLRNYVLRRDDLVYVLSN